MRNIYTIFILIHKLEFQFLLHWWKIISLVNLFFENNLIWICFWLSLTIIIVLYFDKHDFSLLGSYYTFVLT